eukprot:gene15743-biopygen10111
MTRPRGARGPRRARRWGPGGDLRFGLKNVRHHPFINRIKSVHVSNPEPIRADSGVPSSPRGRGGRGGRGAGAPGGIPGSPSVPLGVTLPQQHKVRTRVQSGADSGRFRDSGLHGAAARGGSGGGSGGRHLIPVMKAPPPSPAPHCGRECQPLFVGAEEAPSLRPPFAAPPFQWDGGERRPPRAAPTRLRASRNGPF